MTQHDEDTRGPEDTRRPDDVRGTDDAARGRDGTSDTTRDLDRSDDSARDDDSRDSGRADVTANDDDMVIINDVEDYASTEPLPMEEQTPEASTGDRDDVDTTADRRSDEPTTEDTWDDDTRSADTTSTGATAAGATAAGAAATGRHAADTDGDTTTDTNTNTDPDRDRGGVRDGDGDGDSRDDALTNRKSERVSDEDLLGGDDSTRDRAEGGDATHWPDGTDRVNTADDSDTGRSDDTRRSDESGGDTGSQGGRGSRRTSEVDEIRDGGYGVGSAAPLEDRAQPRDHPVQAYRDTMTYRTPDAPGYDSAEPDVWFYDEDAARQAGFNPSGN